MNFLTVVKNKNTNSCINLKLLISWTKFSGLFYRKFGFVFHIVRLFRVKAILLHNVWAYGWFSDTSLY